METSDFTLKYYLSKLNDAPLLTRKEELELLKNIEKLQTEILLNCLSSEFFKSELLSVLKNQNLKNIVKLSRKLDENSKSAEIKKIKKSFLNLIEGLEQPKTSLKEVQGLLSQVSLSGTLVYTLMTKIKDKYSKIQKYNDDLKILLKYFEVENSEDLENLVVELERNQTARQYQALKLYTTEQRLLTRSFEFRELQKSLKTLESLGIGADHFKDVTGLYKEISHKEKDMQSFKDTLVTRNLRLVVSRAKKFTNRGLEFEDLVQEGNIGLMKAITKHDSSRGTKISTYATWWIDQSIRRAISNKSKTVRIPTHIEFLRTQISSAANGLTTKLGRTPTNSELADQLGIDVETLNRLDSVALYEIGIEEVFGNSVFDSSGISMLDILPSDPSESPFQVLSQKFIRERVRELLSYLSPRTEKIIRLRFGIGEPNGGLTFKEITEYENLSKMGILKIQEKGLEKIERLIKIKKLESELKE